jgi:nicotinamide-nucleotide amidase
MMYRCSVLAVGNELLEGRVEDKNSGYIAEKLASLGMEVPLRLMVGDDMDDLRAAISWLMGQCDVIVITGGLGPTEDDLTREAVAEALDLPLKRNADIERDIEAIFNKMARDMPASNLKQADLIEGAIPLLARLGTAPGQWIEHEGKLIILLPGVPSEMRHLMSGEVLPRMEARFPAAKGKKHHSFIVAARPESEVAEVVREATAEFENLQLSYRVESGQIEVRLSSREGGGDLMSKAARQVREALGPWLVAEGDATLEGNLGRELRSRGLTLAIAESCTGGMISERVTRLPGSSDYFKGGMVAYTYESKETLLGVPGSLLKEKGAACEEVAKAMAEGVRERFSSSLGIAVTGVAGPGKGGEKEPVGSVAFGLSARDGTYSWKYRLPGDRDAVRRYAATIMLAVTYFYVRGDGRVDVRR